MTPDNFILPFPSPSQLTALAAVPAEDEWFANLHNKGPRMYDQRDSRPEQSPVFKVRY